MSHQSLDPGSAQLTCLKKVSELEEWLLWGDYPSVTLRARHQDMDDDAASVGVEVIILEDEDFKEMFSETVEENIEHWMSRVSLQDHDYHQPRQILEVK